MKESEKREEGSGTPGNTRRIVVSDSSLETPREVRGRRLDSPPNTRTVSRQNPNVNRNAPTIRKSYLIAGVGACLVLIIVVAVLALKNRSQPKGQPLARQQSTPVVPQALVPSQSEELRRVEDDAKQVIRRISRDNKPYSFSENAVKDIQSRVLELSRSPYVSDSLLRLQAKSEVIGSQAGKEGLQPSLVMLMALALTKGGESGDSPTAATRALPLLASLNKTFGSSEADSCLILIAAFREGAGTQRSHPLIRRMNRVVTNPLTERNVWYLNDQNVLAADAYDLVINTIAYGVIARNPRQFGLQNDPLSF